MIQNKKILVTGGAGFIGSNLCDALIDLGNKVICLDNLLTGKYENIKELDKNSAFTFIEGDTSRDFTYVKNVVQANLLAGSTTNEKAYNEVFNVAFGANNSLNQLFALLIELLGKFNPEILSAKANYGPERIGDVKHSLASIEKARAFLSYNPEYSLQKGLREAIDWYWEYLK